MMGLLEGYSGGIFFFFRLGDWGYVTGRGLWMFSLGLFLLLLGLEFYGV